VILTPVSQDFPKSKFGVPTPTKDSFYSPMLILFDPGPEILSPVGCGRIFCVEIKGVNKGDEKNAKKKRARNENHSEFFREVKFFLSCDRSFFMVVLIIFLSLPGPVYFPIWKFGGKYSGKDASEIFPDIFKILIFWARFSMLKIVCANSHCFEALKIIGRCPRAQVSQECLLNLQPFCILPNFPNFGRVKSFFGHFDDGKNCVCLLEKLNLMNFFSRTIFGSRLFFTISPGYEYLCGIFSFFWSSETEVNFYDLTWAKLQTDGFYCRPVSPPTVWKEGCWASKKSIPNTCAKALQLVLSWAPACFNFWTLCQVFISGGYLFLGANISLWCSQEKYTIADIAENIVGHEGLQCEPPPRPSGDILKIFSMRIVSFMLIYCSCLFCSLSLISRCFLAIFYFFLNPTLCLRDSCIEGVKALLPGTFSFNFQFLSSVGRLWLRRSLCTRIARRNAQGNGSSVYEHAERADEGDEGAPLGGPQSQILIFDGQAQVQVAQACHDAVKLRQDAQGKGSKDYELNADRADGGVPLGDPQFQFCKMKSQAALLKTFGAHVKTVGAPPHLSLMTYALRFALLVLYALALALNFLKICYLRFV
jgi:hypothetical protein